MFAFVGVGTNCGVAAKELVFDPIDGAGELTLGLVTAGDTLLLLTASRGLTDLTLAGDDMGNLTSPSARFC